MKRPNIAINLYHAVITGLMFVALTACKENFIRNAGDLPSTDGENYGMLQDATVADNEKVVLIHDGEATPQILTYRLMKPAERALTVSLTPVLDEETVEAWNDAQGLKDVTGQGGVIWVRRYKPFPAEKLSLEEGDKISIEANALKGELSLTLDAADLEEGRYLIPVKVVPADNFTTEPGSDTFYYRVHVFKKGEQPTSDWKKPFIFAGFANVSEVQPQIVLEWECLMSDFDTFDDKKSNWFDIVNLVATNVQYDAISGMPKLYNNGDMAYVLQHREKYIMPIQDPGIKVCLTLKGGGQSIGFCNLSEQQRESLVAQVKIMVEQYGLDGVCLWDEESNYGSNPILPAIDPASYPRFIKALREAMPDKLITLVDIGEPTANFHEAVDGIEVGKYIDYAWTGYEFEGINPWGENPYGRKPIAGLKKEQYGGITVAAIKRKMPSIEDAPDPSFIFFVDYDEYFNQIYPNLQKFYDDSGLYHTFATSQISPFTHTKEMESGGAWWGLLLGYYPGYVIDMMEFTGRSISCPKKSDGKFSLGGYLNNYYIPDWK